MSPNKSGVHFTPNIENSTQRCIRGILVVKEMRQGSVYLENSLLFGKQRTKEFNRIKERTQTHHGGWQN